MRLLRAVAIIAVMTIAYIWLHAGYRIGAEFERELNASLRDQAVQARYFARYLEHEIDERDRLLRQVRADYSGSGDKTQAPSFLQRYAGAYGGLYSELIIIGANGRVLARATAAAGGTDFSQQALYIAHRENADDTLRMGRPYQLPGTGEWVLTLTRRLVSSAGKFGGVAMLRFSMDQVSDFYRHTDVPGGGARLAAGRTGIATETPPAQVMLSLIGGQSAGSLPVAAATEVPHAGACQLGPYPILLSVRFARPASIPTQLRRKLDAYMTFALVPTVLISVLLFFIYKTLRRQYAVVRKYDGMRRRAVDAAKRKSRFLATVVHELRTPLTGIQGYSELVRDESSDALSRDFSDLIYQSAIHLHGLLNTLFDLARIEAGKVVIFREPIQTAAFFSYIGALHQLAAQKKQLRFRLLLAPDLPAQFFSDRLRLAQVLNNLLDNAIKFTAHGGIALEIAALKREIRFRVTDTGPGMEKKDLKHLFEYFYQTETVRAQRGHGLGLGLSLAKEFTELIGGSIRIESEPGVGTVVELTIPMDSR